MLYIEKYNEEPQLISHHWDIQTSTSFAEGIKAAGTLDKAELIKALKKQNTFHR